MGAPDPVLTLELFPLERDALLQLLISLSEEDWEQPTICPGWSVKDIVLHLLGDDIGLLSRKRDSFSQPNAPRLTSWDELVTFINQNNERWVEATRRISPQIACTLLRLTGIELYQYLSSLDPLVLGDPVSWAGPDAAPVWLDIAREYTERWLHQQQIRDAVGKPGFKEPYVFAPVLQTFVYALPRTFSAVDAPDETIIQLTITGAAGGEWFLRREQERWALHMDGEAAHASVVLDQEIAWRLFTKGISKEAAIQQATLKGDDRLAMKVLDTVSIIA